MKLKLILVGMFAVSAGACNGGSDEPSDPINRIDGPAVVDEDQGGAVDVGDGRSDG